MMDNAEKSFRKAEARGRKAGLHTFFTFFRRSNVEEAKAWRPLRPEGGAFLVGFFHLQLIVAYLFCGPPKAIYCQI